MVYMIALIRINNLTEFKTYRAKVAATLEPFGGEIQFKAKKIVTLVDENELGSFSQIAFFSFPSQENINKWYASDEYSGLKGLRGSAGTFTIIGLTPDRYDA